MMGYSEGGAILKHKVKPYAQKHEYSQTLFVNLLPTEHQLVSS